MLQSLLKKVCPHSRRVFSGIQGISSTTVRHFPVVPFRLADIGEGIAEVEVLEWYVKEGDKIGQFDAVCQVQSDKATVDITSRFDGVVKKIHYSIGDMASVGTPLIDIESDDSSIGEEKKSTEFQTSTETFTETFTETTTFPSIQNVEEKIVAIEEKVYTKNDGLNDVHEYERGQVTRKTGDHFKVLTTPSVRRLAKEHGIDLQQVTGTGKEGRLLKADVLNAIRANSEEAPQFAEITLEEKDSFVLNEKLSKEENKTMASRAAITEDVVVPIKGMQRIMVKSMNAALRIPHFGYGDEVAVDALFELRNQLLPLAKEKNVKLSYLPFLLKAASLALKQYPILNSTLSECESQVTLLADHNISIAMDTPRGLVVPNVKGVQNKSIFDIASDISKLQVLGNEGKLGENELKGGTFTISNIGSIGGTYMSPVILQPQVAIGAVGKILTVPRFDDEGNVRPIRQMNVSWSGDHRVIDGATMARFSNLWKSYLENPVSMLTELK